MSRISVFARQVAVGDRVSLRLTRGEDVAGRVSELDDHHICVQTENRQVTIFEDILAGWDVLERTSARVGARDTSRHHQALPAEPVPPAKKPAAGDGVGGEPVENGRVVAVRAAIEAKFAEGMKRAKLQAPEPDFAFPEEEFPERDLQHVRREWERARNQFSYAVKINELSRLQVIVGQILRPLSFEYPGRPSLDVLMGLLLWKLDRKRDAEELIRGAATRSNRADHWYALASTAGNTALECFALRNHLLARRPEEANEAWLRYLALALDHRDVTGLVATLSSSADPAAPSSTKALFLESLVFVFTQLREETAAAHGSRQLVIAHYELPAGWREILERAIGAASAELLEIERDAAWRYRQKERAPAETATPRGQGTGRIVSFGASRFGFLETPDGQTYFFRVDDVVDHSLRQALQEGAWKQHPDVEFLAVSSPGYRYPRATNVIPAQDSQTLLRRAQELRRLKQHAQAIPLVRRVLGLEPGNQAAVKLEADIRKEIGSLGIGLPKGRGPYAQAKRAQLADLDLEKAEELLREAIRRHDNQESAVKDLASLLQQQRRFDEARLLLESSSQHVSGSSPYDNMLATLYQQMGLHEEAIGLLVKLAKQATDSTQRVLLRRLSFSYVKLERYQEAERTLKILLDRDPTDRVAQRWLDELEAARRTGSYAEAEETILGGLEAVPEEGIHLTPLAQGAIEACTFEGVDPAKVRAGDLTVWDVRRLEDLAKKLGTRRPRDRAAYYLSAAAILHRNPGDGRTGRLYDYLRRYFASMGDAAWVDKKPADVIRAYYVESLALVSDRMLYEGWRTLVRYLATAMPDRLANVEQALPHGDSPTRNEYMTTLRRVMETLAQQPIDKWGPILAWASALSSFAAEAIWEAIQSNPTNEGTIMTWLGHSPTPSTQLAEVLRQRGWQLARERQNCVSLCKTMERHQLTPASMEEVSAEMRGMVQAALCDLDRRRLTELIEISDAAFSYCRAADFEEKEQQYWFATTRATSFCEQIREAPTQVSHDGFARLAEHLRLLIEEDYAALAEGSKAELGLQLLVEEYFGFQGGSVRLQVRVSNRPGCSPASDVYLFVGPHETPYLANGEVQAEIAPTLRGGASKEEIIILPLSNRAATERAFPVKARARYRNRSGEECWTSGMDWTVRLYPETEFEPIENPYAPYAEGKYSVNPLATGRGLWHT